MVARADVCSARTVIQAQEFYREQREVDGEKEVQVVIAGRDGSFDAGEWTGTGVVVGDDRGVAGEVGAVARYGWRKSESAEFSEGVFDERTAVKVKEGLVAAHPDALPAGENKGVHAPSSSKKTMIDSMPR